MTAPAPPGRAEDRRRAGLAVVGGGPIGLATAIAARQLGLEVVLLERRQPPLEKACGEGIMPDGVEILSSLGVSLAPPDAMPFVGIRFIDGDIVATARFRGRPGQGIRRTVLQAALLQRAREAGVRLRFGVTVQGLHPEGVDTDHGPVPARWVIAADGASSRLRSAVALNRTVHSRRFGLRRHYAIRPWSDYVEVYWADGVEAYITPVGPRLVCVAMLTGAASPRFDEALARFPSLAHRLGTAPVASRLLGAGSVFQSVHPVVLGRLALVGDASGSVDAITGDGISLGVHQAVALARALRRENLSLYDAAHRRLMRLPSAMTRLLLSVDRRRRTRRAALRMLRSAPVLFNGLLGLHTRSLWPASTPKAARPLRHSPSGASTR
ncbi:MAG: NAD(P)/FAD-dependent oxidoreductase [Acidobacteriota bacterium]